MLQASRIEWDLHRVDHYESYDKFDWQVALPYNSDIPRAVWNPPLTRWGSPQPKCATRVGVPESDTQQGSRLA
ncbi:hypothetical protein CQW23_09136 [Capsicum baccatum]|uniref:Uncharacterized protein n=1 Tax=Capsicum baccatum TaxID=33114 RepID=A0A2G2WW42_CAPBA|nr:hypothetical protein CQW23_09136 [Capsicum baccatum]